MSLPLCHQCGKPIRPSQYSFRQGDKVFHAPPLSAESCWATYIDEATEETRRNRPPAPEGETVRDILMLGPMHGGSRESLANTRANARRETQGR